jgi:hypothetical protein
VSACRSTTSLASFQTACWRTPGTASRRRGSAWSIRRWAGGSRRSGLVKHAWAGRMRTRTAFRRGRAGLVYVQIKSCVGTSLNGSCSPPTLSCAPFLFCLRGVQDPANIDTAQLTFYSLCSLIICLLIWFDVWSHADVVRVGNRPELVVSTLAATMGIFTATLGWAGIMMNNRSFLAVYTFLLWIAFIFLLVPGYLTYKRHTFNLEGKINAQWSRDLGADGRLRIQNQLSCCGYFSPFVEATVSQTCYARSMLPGCKLDYLRFERKVLRKWYTTVFSIVPVHIVIIVAGLLCSNHVTYRFGKGMMPKAYRLSMTSMAVIMDNYAT